MAQQAQVSRSVRRDALEQLEPNIRTFPSEPKRAPRPWAAWIVGLAGLAALGVGAACVWGPARSEPLAELGLRLAAASVQPGHLFGAGATLLALALVGMYVGRVARTILTPGAIEDSLTEVGADLAEFRNKLYEFENDHVHFRATLEAVRKEVQEHRARDRSQEAVDALFSMAGSLDTLHARFDQKLTETSREVSATLGELGSLIEASRDYLQDSLEETDQRVAHLAGRVAQWTPDTPASASAPIVDEPFALEAPTFDEPVPSLGLLDDLDDLTPDESWCDDEVREEIAAIEGAQAEPFQEPPHMESAQLSLAERPARIELETPVGPLPSELALEAQDPTHMGRMQDVVRDPTSAQIVEGLDFEGDQPR